MDGPDRESRPSGDRPGHPRAADSEGLHLTCHRSWGFAGIDLVAACPGADLPEDQVKVALDLLGAPTSDRGGHDSSTASSPFPTGADQFTYTVHIVDGTRGRTFTWSEASVPDSVRPLLALLGARSQPGPGP